MEIYGYLNSIVIRILRVYEQLLVKLFIWHDFRIHFYLPAATFETKLIDFTFFMKLF